jgi:hypothetical protein
MPRKIVVSGGLDWTKLTHQEFNNKQPASLFIGFLNSRDVGVGCNWLYFGVIMDFLGAKTAI